MTDASSDVQLLTSVPPNSKPLTMTEQSGLEGTTSETCGFMLYQDIVMCMGVVHDL
jgi:hypothetical protein